MRTLLLLSACLLAGSAYAEEVIVAPSMESERLSADEIRMLEDRAKALHEKANLMRQDAEASYTAEHNACWQKFLVSDCQNDAKKAKTARLLEAGAVDKEARGIDRKVGKAKFAEEQAKKAEEAPKRAAEAAEQAEKNRQAREEAMARVEKKRQEAGQRK